MPTEEQYNPEGADIAKGGELFRTNCAQCHNFTGKGGALTNGKYAPTLEDVDPKHLYEAMQTGPQNMPSFPDTTLTEKNKQDIIAYLARGQQRRLGEPRWSGAGRPRAGQ